MFLTANQEWVKNCPSCQTKYTENKELNCPLTCKERKLEEKHEKLAQKIVDHYFYKEKIKLSFPRDTLKIWGWTNVITKTITIPWLTLRSKEEFFDTLVHEIAHLIAFRKKFNLKFRKILSDFYYLRQEDRFFSSPLTEKKLEDYYLLHQPVIDNYRLEFQVSKGGHWYDPWHLEYLKLFKKLLVSPYKKYAYNTKSRPHGFNEKGEGEYDMSKKFVKKEKSPTPRS